MKPKSLIGLLRNTHGVLFVDYLLNLSYYLSISQGEERHMRNKTLYALILALTLICAIVSCKEQSPSEESVRSDTAAQGDSAAAQYELGMKYYNGDGVPQDYQQAVEWFTKAAEQGEARAQFMLGVLYDTGEGVPKDLVQSYKWLNLAAGQGKTEAAEVRDELTPQMTPEQIAEAQRLSTEFYQKQHKAE